MAYSSISLPQALAKRVRAQDTPCQQASSKFSITILKKLDARKQLEGEAEKTITSWTLPGIMPVRSLKLKKKNWQLHLRHHVLCHCVVELEGCIIHSVGDLKQWVLQYFGTLTLHHVL